MRLGAKLEGFLAMFSFRGMVVVKKGSGEWCITTPSTQLNKQLMTLAPLVYSLVPRLVAYKQSRQPLPPFQATGQ